MESYPCILGKFEGIKNVTLLFNDRKSNIMIKKSKLSQQSYFFCHKVNFSNIHMLSNIMYKN